MLHFLLVLILLLSPSLALAVRYEGETTLYEDTVWEGEVVIDGIVTVAPEVRLELRPGTRVLFTRRDSNGDGIGENELFIQGIFVAEGTEEAPIVFASGESEPRPGDWGAVNMMASTEPGRLRHCSIRHAYRGFHAHFADAVIEDSLFTDNVQALQFQDSNLVLTRLAIEGNRNGLQFRDSEVRMTQTRIEGNHWGLRCLYSSLEMDEVSVRNNRLNGINLRESFLKARRSSVADNRRGIYLQDSEGRLEQVSVTGNFEHGMLLENAIVDVDRSRFEQNGRAGVKWIDSHGTVRRSALIHNGEFDLVNDGKSPADVRENWWGELDSGGRPRRILNEKRRADAGEVRWEPALSSPAPQLPTY